MITKQLPIRKRTKQKKKHPPPPATVELTRMHFNKLYPVTEACHRALTVGDWVFYPVSSFRSYEIFRINDFSVELRREKK